MGQDVSVVLAGAFLVLLGVTLVMALPYVARALGATERSDSA